MNEREKYQVMRARPTLWARYRDGVLRQLRETGYTAEEALTLFEGRDYQACRVLEKLLLLMGRELEQKEPEPGLFQFHPGPFKYASGMCAVRDANRRVVVELNARVIYDHYFGLGSSEGCQVVDAAGRLLAEILTRAAEEDARLRAAPR